MKQATRAPNDTIKIQFEFSWDTVNAVKTIPGRRFHDGARGKYWTCPVSPTAIAILQAAGFQLGSDLIDSLPRPTPKNGNDENLLAQLKKPLYPFQREGVRFLQAKSGRVLLADEMGLGKTIQALAWLHCNPKARPAVVLCPAHLKLNWDREIRETLPGPHDSQVIFGTDASQPITSPIVIINYDLLHHGWLERLQELKPRALIIDEAHYCRNSGTHRTKATRKLAKKVPHVIALSGTPIVNRPVDGFNIIQMIDKSLFPNWWIYVHRYCAAKHTGFGWDFNGASNTMELHQKLTDTIMLRRLKAEVLPELPNKVFSYIPFEIDNARKYAAAERDFVEFVLRTRGREAAERVRAAEYLARIEGLKQLATAGKLRCATQWISDFLENNGKLVVFAVHKSAIDHLAKTFGPSAVKVDGSVPAPQRDRAVRAFQERDDVRLFIGQVQAAGTGINLTAASSVAFLELPWTPGEVTQAEDRCHRIGQSESVSIYFLLAHSTIEERIATLLDKKAAVLSQVMDGVEASTEGMLSSLIRTYHDST